MKMLAVKVKMRDGSVVDGICYDRREKDSTIRFTAPPKMERGAYGLQLVDYSYRDILNEYIEFLPEESCCAGIGPHLI